MKCEQCGEEIKSLLVDTFRQDGSDIGIEQPIVECEGDAVFIETERNWTGYDLTEEEMLETIICPHCGRFPFRSKEIQVYDVVRVVCFRGGPDGSSGSARALGEMNKGAKGDGA